MNKPKPTDRPRTMERSRAVAGQHASPSGKRGYVAPQLSTYGPIAKLTQTSTMSGSDAGGGSMRACL